MQNIQFIAGVKRLKLNPCKATLTNHKNVEPDTDLRVTTKCDFYKIQKFEHTLIYKVILCSFQRYT